MLRSLYGKLSLILLAFMVLMAALFILLTLFSTRLYFQETSQRLNQAFAKSLVAERSFFRDGHVDSGVLEDVYGDLMELNPEMDLYLLDRFGHILDATVPEERIGQDHVALEPVYRFLEGKGTFPILGDDPADPGMMNLFSACTIPVEGEVEGYLYIILGGVPKRPGLARLVESRSVTYTLYAVVAGLLVVSLFALLIFNQVTRRLAALTRRVEGFAEESDTESGHEPLRGGDEIDRLGRAYSRLEERILRQVEALRRSDRLRRELVTNVSHDLRTPLTSLQGYLETLAFKEDMTPEQRREYLETALRHSDRLRKLVSDLFELSKLDSAEIPLEPEPFALPELVQDVLQKFELQASEKGVALDADVARDVPFVSGDIGRIERVLENLVKNGIDYTPGPGEVTVALRRQGDLVKVRISDTGTGIPPESLEHIFQPYYRARGSEKQPHGSGLGLAISRRILKLHGSELEVESEVGRGTTFSFSLPAAR